MHVDVWQIQYNIVKLNNNNNFLKSQKKKSSFKKAMSKEALENSANWTNKMIK